MKFLLLIVLCKLKCNSASKEFPESKSSTAPSVSIWSATSYSYLLKLTSHSMVLGLSNKTFISHRCCLPTEKSLFSKANYEKMW